ncbi:cation/H(+) antiporter 15-like isoform X1 [Papaver somniferum]|nr:cation/H(+) antiporter 15-like isoform X1 [Papaver somniferum]
MAQNLQNHRACTIPGKVGSGGLFYEHLSNFSGFAPLPSICLQITILSLAPHLVHIILSRFHQPLLVSQILGGVLASPWILGYPLFKIKNGSPMGITHFVFAVEGFQALDMLAQFSSMFFMFKVGVQMDPKILKRARWRTYIIGFCCILCSYISGVLLSHRFKNYRVPGFEGFPTSTRIVNLFGMISFPVIAYVLNDLTILNSELGNLAVQIAMVADFLHMSEKFTTLYLHVTADGNPTQALTVVSLLLGTLIYIYFIVRPAGIWIVKNTPEGRPVNDIYISLLMISVPLCGLASEYCGLNGTVGAFFLGLAIPDGPPLGSALVDKLRIVSVFFMPLHMGIIGYRTDIHKVHFSYLWRVLLVILSCILGKIIGLFLPAVLLGVSARDSLLLGLIMNFKGIVEVSILSTWLDLKYQRDIVIASDTIMVLTLIVLVAVITPAVKYLYDPSSKYLTYKGRSILQSNQNISDFRVLACVHSQDDILGIIRLLEATNPTKLHPLTVYVLHLIELVGRSTPLFIAHPLRKRASTSNPTKSERIINVFQQFQNRYQNLVTVHSFSTISPYASMHNDICTLSVDKMTALTIFPFCRQDDLARPDISNRSIKTLLQNLLRSSPCSVGILVNCNNYQGLSARFQGQSTRFLPDMPYRVIVFFFGGPDDREALAFAMNMIRNPSVFVTLVRFRGPASLPSDGVIDYYNYVERHEFLDDELVDNFRLNVNAMYDATLIYKEVEVKDCAETVWAIRSLHVDYDLMVVGRLQITDSNIIPGLATDWDDCEELGAIGNTVTSPDFEAESSILIIHQSVS